MSRPLLSRSRPGLVRALAEAASGLPPGALSRSVRDLGRRQDGAVAILFGFLLLPLALLTGAALDYSRAADARAQLSAAADAAALSTVTSMSMGLTAAKAKALATQIFTDRAATTPFATNVTATVNVQDSASGRSTSVTFQATVPTTLLKLAGWSTVPVGGDAKASSAPPVYIDFYMLLDNSPSMGVGATTADIATMMSNTPDQCAFACHDLSAGGNDYYALAKKLGVTMRIDLVRTATQQLMDTATSTSTVSGQYRAGIYTFGTVCGSVGVTTVSAVTSNLSGVKTSAAAVDLMTTPFQNFNYDQCTDYDGLLTAMNAVIPNPGTGVTAASPQKVLFFVTDGVADAAYPATCTRPTTSGRCQEPITVATCTALKARGIKVAVLYTTYLPLPTNSWYNTWIAPFASSIPANMASCASPGLYFEVSPSQGIADAMTALFKKSVAQARISE